KLLFFPHGFGISIMVFCIPQKGLKVGFLSNGYLLATTPYRPHLWIYVGATNHIISLNSALQVLDSFKTGPTCAGTQTGPCGLPLNGANCNNTNQLLLIYFGNGKRWLFSCGDAGRGACLLHELPHSAPHDVSSSVKCLFRSPQPHDCPDCVVSPLGSCGLLVSLSQMYLYVGNEVKERPAQGYSNFTLSRRRLLATINGFDYIDSDTSTITVTPSLHDNYHIHYVHSFTSGRYAYFLSVHREIGAPPVYHTRLARLCKDDDHLHSYVELTLQCTFNERRRKRSSSGGLKIYNLLQAATVGRVGLRLARLKKFRTDEDVLFGVFAQSEPNSNKPLADSAVCAFSLNRIDERITEGLQQCFSGGTGQKQTKGLEYFFVEPRFCEPKVSDRRLLYTRILVPTAYDRHDLFQQTLKGFRITSITVAVAESDTVFSLGTDSGCIFFVIDVLAQLTAVPAAGPACQHYLSCSSCLSTPDLLKCGWCAGRCTVQKQCLSYLWMPKSCPPIVKEVSPERVPAQGGTVLTIRGDYLMMSDHRGSNRYDVQLHETICNVHLETCNRTTYVPTSSAFPMPKVQTFSPRRGPAAGGTLLTVTGNDLDAGSDVFVSLGNTPWIFELNHVPRSQTLDQMHTVGPIRPRIQNVPAHVSMSHTDMEDSHSTEEFLREAIIMRDLEHPNVLSLLGISLTQHGAPLVVLPYMKHGDVAHFIRQESHVSVHLCSTRVHLPDDRKYLHFKPTTHTNNCSNNRKLGLPKTDQMWRVQSKYIPMRCKTGRRKRPGWLSSEIRNAMKERQKWSFGVLLWELLTRGVPPYADIDPFDMTFYLLSGRRLPQPEFCPATLFQLMVACWQPYPEARPSFPDIVTSISALLSHLEGEHYISLHPTYVNLDQKSPYEPLNQTDISAEHPDTFWLSIASVYFLS
uniref:Hepatocyte growth factor receptor n=1 Tax=Eptatretus burgeri TaxID=7764 RepID=A0A8C4R588_EPTBU